MPPIKYLELLERSRRELHRPVRAPGAAGELPPGDPVRPARARAVRRELPRVPADLLHAASTASPGRTSGSSPTSSPSRCSTCPLFRWLRARRGRAGARRPRCGSTLPIAAARAHPGHAARALAGPAEPLRRLGELRATTASYLLAGFAPRALPGARARRAPRVEARAGVGLAATLVLLLGVSRVLRSPAVLLAGTADRRLVLRGGAARVGAADRCRYDATARPLVPDRVRIPRLLAAPVGHRHVGLL